MKKRQSVIKRPPEPARFLSLSYPFLAARYDMAALCRHLWLPDEYHLRWAEHLFVPPLWSQYLRETDFGAKPVNRRWAKTGEMAALLGGIRGLQAWMGKQGYRKEALLVDLRRPFLLERHSIVLEYSYRGLVKPIPRYDISAEAPSGYGSIDWNHG